MKLFNLDLHVSVIEDIRSILEEQGHTVDSKSISGHSWIFGREVDVVDVVNQHTWRNLNFNMADAFYERYKEELSHYDGFIVTHTPSFCLLFERFNKPIYVVASTRYEAPFSNNIEMWESFNERLVTMIDNGQVIPLANNLYDARYCEFFTQREWKHVPSICDYTNTEYTGKEATGLFSGKGNLNLPYMPHLKSLGTYEGWERVFNYKYIAHIPYNVSIMSIFEQYTANMPLLFPTLPFAKTLPSFLSELFYPNPVIGKFKGDGGSYLTDDSSLMLADFYDTKWMPHILYFDSLAELQDLSESVNFKEVSKKMGQFNISRKEKIHSLWRNILN